MLPNINKKKVLKKGVLPNALKLILLFKVGGDGFEPP